MKFFSFGYHSAEQASNIKQGNNLSVSNAQEAIPNLLVPGRGPSHSV